MRLPPQWYAQAKADYEFGLSYREIAEKHGKSRSAVILALGKAGPQEKRNRNNAKWREKIEGRKPYRELAREFHRAVVALLDYLEANDDEGLIGHADAFAKVRSLSNEIATRAKSVQDKIDAK